MGCVNGVYRQSTDQEDIKSITSKNNNEDNHEDSVEENIREETPEETPESTQPKKGLVKDRIRMFGEVALAATLYKPNVSNMLKTPPEVPVLRRKSESNNDPLKRLSNNSSSSGNSSFSYRINEDMDEEIPNDLEQEDAEKKSRKEYRCQALRVELLETERTMYKRYNYLFNVIMIIY